MSQLLAAALGQLNLQPGQIYRTTVNGHEYEVKALDVRSMSEIKTAFEHGQGIMLEPWFAIPNPATAGVVRATLDNVPQFDPPMIPPESEQLGCHVHMRQCRRNDKWWSSLNRRRPNVP